MNSHPSRKALFCGLSLFCLLAAPHARAQGAAYEANHANSGTSSASAKALNPDISVDGLFSGTQFNRPDPLVFEGGHDPKVNGFTIQQVELSFGAAIDPYFRGDANLVLTPEGIEIEEAYATTTDFPWNLQLKGGQFFTAFGRNNPMHPHAWDFANKPLVLGRFFGGDGLRNPGVQVSWLTPLPWYSEIMGSAQNSTGETAPSFRPDTDEEAKMRSAHDFLTMIRSNNFVSITDELGLGFGVSYLNGPNSTARTRIYGGDLYLKYRRPETLSFLSLTFEVLKRSYDAPDAVQEDSGWYSVLNYRLDAPWERWHVGIRYDRVTDRIADVNTSIGEDTSARYRLSPSITFYPSEFSKVRFQYDYDKPDNFEQAQQAGSIQLEFLMGAHGAHKF